MRLYVISVEGRDGETAEQWTRARSIGDALEHADELAEALGISGTTAAMDGQMVFGRRGSVAISMGCG